MSITIEHEKPEDQPDEAPQQQKPEQQPAEYDQNTPGWPWDL